MNSVSWLIYASNILPNIAGLFLFIGVISTIAALVVTVLAVLKYQNYSWNRTDNRVGKQIFPKIGRWNFILIPMLFIFLSVAAIIPNSNTILLIATSQFGETFIQSSTGTQVAGLMQDTLKLLQKQIDTQLGKDSKNGN